MRNGSLPSFTRKDTFVDMVGALKPMTQRDRGNSGKFLRTGSIALDVRRPVAKMSLCNLPRMNKLSSLSKNNGSIMLPADSSPTHIYFAERLLKLKEEQQQTSRRGLTNQNHRRIKKLGRKQDELQVNFLKKYFREQGD